MLDLAAAAPATHGEELVLLLRKANELYHELAPPTPGNGPPMSLLAALSHDRGAVSVRPPPHVRSPATLPPPGERPGQTANSCWSTNELVHGRR